MNLRRLVFPLVALLCLSFSCALSTPAPAQPDSLVFTHIEVGNSHEVHPDGSQTWSEGGFATIFDPEGGDNVSLFRAVTPGGAVIEKTPETVDGNYATLGWGTPSHLLPPETPPDLGSYELTAWNLDGDSVTVTSLPLDQFSGDAPTILWPVNSGTITDTQPIFSWTPALDASPYPLSGYWAEVHGPSDEWRPGQRSVWFRTLPTEAEEVRFNDDGAAGVPELTPGTTYRIAIDQTNKACVDPGGNGRPEQWHAHASWRAIEFTIASSALTSFEEERYPWSGFAAGPDEAAVWREVFVPEGAHSGAHAVVAEVSGQAISGLRLDLPVGPTEPAGASLRSWVYVDERTADISSFFGFAFTDGYPDSATGWSQAIGWEALSATESRLQLGGSSMPLAFGLPAGGWHLVRVNYHRADDALRVWLDGVLIADVIASGAAGAAPHQALLGALGQSATAVHVVRFDDASILPMLDVDWPDEVHPFARIAGREEVVEGEECRYEIRYGNGYPALGTEPLSETLPDAMYVGLTLPTGYTYLGADPAPDRVEGSNVVWEMNLPVFGQEGELRVEVETPTGLPAITTEMLYAWVTTDPAAATANPPDPPNWTSPCDGTWNCPEDVLPQMIYPAADLHPDIWVRKDGPKYASPGDMINYAITVGNRGLAAAVDMVVWDQLPAEMGDGDRVIARLPQLAPGETWRGILMEELPWGIEHGAVLRNIAYISGVADPNPVNDQFTRETTVLAAHDPNAIHVTPEGGVDPGDTLTYTLECENTGAGTAYGVYATTVLAPELDASTLVLPAELAYQPSSRMIVWDVGTLASESGASTSFDVQVAAAARRARPLIGQATVYFPSVPEETPTNIVVNMVNGSFPDVAWNHWALRQIESAFEAGIVAGYPDGGYWPALSVSRDQMAVYISRALAGGEDYVPAGPTEATFEDVPTDHWAFKYVEYAVASDIVEGYSPTIYAPDIVVDRGQMAVFVARSIATPTVGEAGLADYTPTGTPTFADVTPDNDWAWCHKYVEYIAAARVTFGYTDGLFHPEIACCRDQMAVFIARAFRLPL